MLKMGWTPGLTYTICLSFEFLLVPFKVGEHAGLSGKLNEVAFVDFGT